MDQRCGHSRFFAVECLALALTLFGAASIAIAEQETDEKVDNAVSYHQQIRPLFQAKCQGCHQPAKPLGEYVMTSFDKLSHGWRNGRRGDRARQAG